MFEGREHLHLAAGLGEPRVGEPRPQDRVHLGHVRAPEHEGIGVLEVVVTAHRLVDAEGADEAGDGRGHAVAGVRVDIVRPHPRLHELGGGIAFPHRPLAGAEDRNGGRAFLFQGRLPLLGHHVEGLVPAHRLEVALLVVDPVGLAQERRGQPVGAIHDLRQEIALDAVEPAVDRRFRVALGGDDAAVLGADQHRAAGAAEPAGGLVPADVGGAGLGGGDPGQGDAGGRGGRGGGGGLDEGAAGRGQGHVGSPLQVWLETDAAPSGAMSSKWW